MSEWWTYHPSSFLMFAPRTYWRLFELANAAAWPWQLVVVGIGGVGWVMRLKDLLGVPSANGSRWARAAAVSLAVCWLWVAWAFLHQRYADINWPADVLAIAFGVQALALAGFAARFPIETVAPGPRWSAGMLLVAWSLAGQPLLAPALGRPWSQAELIGIAPDPTLIAMLGWLLLVRTAAGVARVILRALWAVPIAGCIASAATLWTMGSPQGWVLAIAVAVAAGGVFWRTTGAARPLQTRPAPPPLRS